MAEHTCAMSSGRKGASAAASSAGSTLSRSSARVAERTGASASAMRSDSFSITAPVWRRSSSGWLVKRSARPTIASLRVLSL
jgi:hypothetical protein